MEEYYVTKQFATVAYSILIEEIKIAQSSERLSFSDIYFNHITVLIMVFSYCIYMKYYKE